jgi:hypothetical protein
MLRSQPRANHRSVVNEDNKSKEGRKEKQGPLDTKDNTGGAKCQGRTAKPVKTIPSQEPGESVTSQSSKFPAKGMIWPREDEGQHGGNGVKLWASRT